MCFLSGREPERKALTLPCLLQALQIESEEEDNQNIKQNLKQHTENSHENTLQNNDEASNSNADFTDHEKNNTQAVKSNLELLQKANKKALRLRNKELEKRLESTVVDMQDVSLIPMFSISSTASISQV